MFVPGDVVSGGGRPVPIGLDDILLGGGSPDGVIASMRDDILRARLRIRGELCHLLLAAVERGELSWSARSWARCDVMAVLVGSGARKSDARDFIRETLGVGARGRVLVRSVQRVVGSDPWLTACRRASS